MSRKISSNDQSVLHLITNPGLPVDEGVVKPAVNQDSEFDAATLERVKQLEKQAIRKVDDCRNEKDSTISAEAYESAMKLLNEAVELLPTRPSAYNNRAQLWRLMGNIDAALEDLNTAIKLSNSEGMIASFAFTQRALIHKKQGSVELANQDFNKSAELGCLFAKKALVQSNPYAALCNEMLQKAFKNLQGKPQQEYKCENNKCNN